MSNAILSAKKGQDLFESPVVRADSSDESLIDNEPEIRLASPRGARGDYGGN